MEYDFKRAKAFIEENKDEIESVSMGMHEDWFWAAETIYENGEYTHNLDTLTKLGGISGSYWATPTICVRYKDGSVTHYICAIGENDERDKLAGQMKLAMMGGCITNEIQENRKKIKLEQIQLGE